MDCLGPPSGNIFAAQTLSVSYDNCWVTYPNINFTKKYLTNPSFAHVEELIIIKIKFNTSGFVHNIFYLL